MSSIKDSSGREVIAEIPPDDSVTDAILRNSAACSVIGRSANSVGNPADILLGTNGFFLSRHSDVVGGAAIVLADLPAIPSGRITHSGAQSINNATITALAWDTEKDDATGMHDTVTNNSRVTIATAGKYIFGACISFAANVTGVRAILFRLSGGNYYVDGSQVASLGGLATAVVAVTRFDLAAADYVECSVYQNSGGALNVEVVADYSPIFWWTRIGA